MKKTKIIVTVGPSSKDINILKEMILKGADVVRINLSHADFKFCDDIIKKVRKLEGELNRPIGIMLDTDGPSVRLADFIEGSTKVELDREIKLYRYPVICNNTQFSTSYEDILEEISLDDEIIFGDGEVHAKVIDKENDYALLKITSLGILRSKMTLHIQGKSFKMPFISTKDREGIMYGIKKKVDFLALSYVRDEQDVLEVMDMLIEHGDNHLSLLSKIENNSAINNLDEIAKVSDGLIVARGDLAVELSFSKLPFFQKNILKVARDYQKIGIVATDFLASMEDSLKPSRSEVSDIYNAVMDKTDAILLSGETTIGKHPVEVVDTMHKTILSAEEDFDYQAILEDTFHHMQNDVTSNIAYSVVDSGSRLNAKAILTNTNSGYTAIKISYFRPKCPILALSPNLSTIRLLTINYGVIPLLSIKCKSTDTIVNMCLKKASSVFDLLDGDIVIITGGFPINTKNTNFMKIEII